MRRFLIAASVLGLSALPAVAADDMMAGYYGNTVVATSPMGESHTWYNADHTFETKLMSYDLKGKWSIDDKGQLCRNYDAPPPGLPNPLCTAWEAHKAGDKWTVTTGNGQTRDISLVKGQV